MKGKQDLLVVCVVALIIILFGWALFTHLEKGIGDEDVHAFQISWFVQGRYEIFKYIPMIPFYHASVAGLSELFDFERLTQFRFAHTFLVSLSIPAIFLLARRLYPQDAHLRTTQYFLTPIFIPWFFLIYTDLYSVLFVALMLERTLAKQYWAAGICAFLAVLVRQPNVIWAAYACALVLLERGNISFRPASIGSYLIDDFRKLWPFYAVFALFIGFVIVNGGVAIGEAENHAVTFNPSNLYFFWLVVFFLFLPFHLSQATRIRDFLGKHSWLWALIILGFFFYWFTYNNSHKYNHPDLEYYRHNLILHWTVDYTIPKLLAFVAMVWAALSMWVAALESAHKLKILWMYLFAALSIAPLPLIEQRYYTVSLCLFLLMRPSVSMRVTAPTLIYYVLASGFILYNISHANFIL